jgi:hypothetical protein
MFVVYVILVAALVLLRVVVVESIASPISALIVISALTITSVVLSTVESHTVAVAERWDMPPFPVLECS